jgi:aminoglycoside phosphotransferase (APT) family kinase protein
MGIEREKWKAEFWEGDSLPPWPFSSYDGIDRWPMTTEELLPVPSLIMREKAATVIDALFPDVDAAELRYLGSGTLYDVFLTIDGWAFRFPRWNWSGDLFEGEATVHKFVAQRIPPRIRIPRVELLAAPSAQFPYPIAGHRYIGGVAADELDENRLPTFAREVATLLNALHSTPTPLVRAAGIHEFIMDEGRHEWLENGVNVVLKLRGLDPVLDRALDWLKTAVLTPRFDAPWHLIHGGLESRHLLVDPLTGFLQGVIDWTDTHLGDAARDFVFLVTWKGWRFAEEVLHLYPRPIDREFRARLRFMAQLLSLMEVAYAYADHQDLARYVREVHNAFAESGA